MFEYHVEGFSNMEAFVEWLEDMNEFPAGYVIDFVQETTYVGYRVMVLYHFEYSAD